MVVPSVGTIPIFEILRLRLLSFRPCDRLGDGEVYTYSDYLAISSYESKPATARQLLQVANSYLDTARAKRPVDGITIVAKDVETPELIWDSEIFG